MFYLLYRALQSVVAPEISKFQLFSIWNLGLKKTWTQVLFVTGMYLNTFYMSLMYYVYVYKLSRFNANFIAYP